MADVLIVYDASWDKNVVLRRDLMTTMAYLDRMGYVPEAMVGIKESTWLGNFATDAQGYKFIVFMYGGFGWDAAENAAPILTGNAVIPTFCLGMQTSDTNSTMKAIGINRVTTSATKWVTHKNGFEYPVITNQYEADSGEGNRLADLTVLTEVQSPTVPATAGRTVFNQAKIVGPSTTVYVDCGGQGSCVYFPMLLQEAINDGLVAAPVKRLTGAVDLDDLPGPTNTLQDLVDIYALQTQYAMPATWGIISDAPAMPDVSQSLYDFVSERSPDRGGLIYPISHAGNTYWDTGNPATNTAAIIESNYLDEIDRMASVGIKGGSDLAGTNSWGYRYFNTNAVNDLGAQVCEKFSMGVMRLATAIPSSTGDITKWLGATDDAQSGPGTSISPHRGMALVTGVSYLGSAETNVALSSDAYARTVSRWANRSLSQGSVLYMHGGNFYNGHSGGNAPGLTVMKAIGDMGAYMSDVVEHVHPSVYGLTPPPILAPTPPTLTSPYSDLTVTLQDVLNIDVTTAWSGADSYIINGLTYSLEDVSGVIQGMVVDSGIRNFSIVAVNAHGTNSDSFNVQVLSGLPNKING